MRRMQLQSLVLIVLCTAMHLSAQSTVNEVYAESFRQGSTRVMEESFEVKLTLQDPFYRERIKDLRGNDRYAFSIAPLGPEGDTKITSWQAKLADLLHPIFTNVLLVSANPTDDPRMKRRTLWAACGPRPSPRFQWVPSAL